MQLRATYILKAWQTSLAVKALALHPHKAVNTGSFGVKVKPRRKAVPMLGLIRLLVYLYPRGQSYHVTFVI